MSNFQSTKTDGSESLFGEVIFSYTRAQAIADRVLIDVTPSAMEAGFRFSTAVTGNSWPRLREYRRDTCRFWDALWMASLAARRAKPGCSRIAFELILHKNALGRGAGVRTVTTHSGRSDVGRSEVRRASFASYVWSIRLNQDLSGQTLRRNYATNCRPIPFNTFVVET